jgi:hypothetical protein
MYNGTLYRSQLESRWALLIDRLDWPKEYEGQPLEGYIPDWYLHFEAAKMIVEIKPAHGFDELVQSASYTTRTGWTGEILALGSEWICEHEPFPTIGAIATPERIAGELEWTWSPAELFHCGNCERLSVLAVDGSWHCRQCGFNDGRAHLGGVPRDIVRAWQEAKNRFQWQPRGGTPAPVGALVGNVLADRKKRAAE